MKSWLLALFVFFSASLPAAASELPRVLVIATGGTIAGEQRDPGTQDGYEIRRPISELISAVPEARKYARIETEQFSNIPSPNITPGQWLQLAKRINGLFRDRPELSG